MHSIYSYTKKLNRLVILACNSSPYWQT